MNADAMELCLESVDGAAQPATLYFTPGTKLGPIPVGTEGKWRVKAPGVIDEHALLYYDGTQLFLQSLDEQNPVLVSGYEVPTEWVAVDPPCTVEMGDARFAFGPAEQDVEIGGVSDPASEDDVPTEAADETRVVSVHDVMASVARHRASSGMTITGAGMPAPGLPPSGSPRGSSPGQRAPAPPAPPSNPGDLLPTPPPSHPFGGHEPHPSGPPSVPTPHSVETPGSVHTPDSVHTAPLGSSPSGRYPAAPGSYPGGPAPSPGVASGSYPGAPSGAGIGPPSHPGGALGEAPTAHAGGDPNPPLNNTAETSNMSMGAGPPPPTKPATGALSSWATMSFPQKATVVLFLPMVASVLVIFFDIGVEKPPPRTAAAPTAAAPTATATATADATETGEPVAVASNDGSETDAGAEGSDGTHEGAEAVAGGSDEGTDEGSETAENDEPADEPQPRLKKGETTLQRKAADAVARADYEKAVAIYEELTKKYPDNEAYAAALLITKSKAAEQQRD